MNSTTIYLTTTDCPYIKVKVINFEDNLFNVWIDDQPAKRLWKLESSRVMFGYNDVLVKIGGMFDNLAQCEVEIDKWKDLIEPADKHYFVPLIAYGIVDRVFWLAQNRIKFIRGRRSDANIEKAFALADKYGIQDLDAKEGWGVSSDGIKIFDWGF